MSKPNPIGIALGLAAAVTFTGFVGKQSWGLIKELPRKAKELTGIVIGTTIALIPIIILRNILKP
jgi:predicted membrane-bound dolichyl-phosphate-mannose-protein mannosyltransferase